MQFVPAVRCLHALQISAVFLNGFGTRQVPGARCREERGGKGGGAAEAEQVDCALPALEKSSCSWRITFAGRAGVALPCWQYGSELCRAIAVLGHAERNGDEHSFPKSLSLASTEAARSDSLG